MIRTSVEASKAIPGEADLAALHGPSLYRIAYGLTGNEQDALDLTQETFLGAIQGLSRLEDGSRVRAWLLSILHNKFVDWLRSHRSRPPSELRSVSPPEENTERAEARRQVRKEILALPEGQRETILLFYVENLDLQKIARILGVPVGTVKSRLHNARERLRQALWVPEVE